MFNPPESPSVYCALFPTRPNSRTICINNPQSSCSVWIPSLVCVFVMVYGGEYFFLLHSSFFILFLLLG